MHREKITNISQLNSFIYRSIVKENKKPELVFDSVDMGEIRKNSLNKVMTELVDEAIEYRQLKHKKKKDDLVDLSHFLMERYPIAKQR